MNIKQHKFVTEYLRMGDKIVAYHNAYPNPKRKDRATESAANRLMQHPEVLKAITDAQETCMYRAMEDLKDKMKEELLNVYQKRLLCKHVVLGEVREEVVFKGKGCAHCSYFREIPYSVKLRYSKEDSLLAGHYPDKRANKHNKTQQNTETLQAQNASLRLRPEDRGTSREEHSHCTNETRNISQQNTGCPPPAPCPPQARGVAKHEPGVGTREELPHQTETRNNPQQPNEESSLHQIPPLKEVPDNRRAEDVHSHETNETQENETQETRNNPQQNTGCPPPAGVAKHEPGVGTREEHPRKTENCNISQQPNEVSSLQQIPPLKEVPDNRRAEDVHSHKTNETPEKENQRLSVSAVKQPRTISHAGLRKLLNKQRIKKQQPLIFTPCV